jgi:hypothetical protein
MKLAAPAVEAPPLIASALGGPQDMTRPLARILIAVSLAAGAFVTGGCSYPEQFFIVNGWATPLLIVASADVYPHAETGARICSWSVHGRSPIPLRRISANRLRRDYVPWDDMSDITASTFDESACSVRAIVEPGTAVLVWGTTNGMRDPFLASMKVGESGETLGKAELLKRFRKRSSAIYVFEPK